MPNVISENTEIIQVATAEPQATATKSLGPVDMQGWDGVVFLGRYKSAATSNRVRLQVATATDGSYTILATTEVNNVTDFRLDVYRPTERYLQLRYSRGTGGTGVVFGDTWAIQYNGRNLASSTQQITFRASPTT